MQLEDIESLDTPEVEKLLQEELSREDTDADLVRQLAQVLRNRDMANNAEVSPEVRALFDQFVERGRRRAESEKPVHRSWVPRAASVFVAVVLAAIFMFTVFPVEAQASSWWDRIVQWTGEMFEFIGRKDASKQRPEYEFCTDNLGLQEVYDTVLHLGVTDPVIPMWLPDGYVLEEIREISSKRKTGVYARFTSGDKYITYTAEVYSEEEGCLYNVDEKNNVEYENAGVTHYITKNKEKCIAIWINRNVECSLTVDDAEELIYEVIDSIYAVRR